MATHFGASFQEGQSTIRPPLLNGLHYSYWKARMRIFIQAQDYNLWNIIINGPHTPTHIINGICLPKPESDWNDRDKKLFQLNARAMNILYCALDVSEFSQISTCLSAKEIWDSLEITHEGTSQVKESRINLLIHKYELFNMESYESISDMFTRFTIIINELKNLGKSLPNSDLVRKILRSLPRHWEAKVTAIQEAKDLNSLSLEELLGSLMTHELQMEQNLDKEESQTKKRTIAFKSSMQQDDDTEEDFDDDENDGDHTLIDEFVRYMMVTSSDSEDSSSDEEEYHETTNLCFTAHNDEDEVSNEPSSDYSFDELHDAFFELMDEYNKICLKNKDFQKTNMTLIKEKDDLSKEKDLLFAENQDLKNEIDKLKIMVDQVKSEKLSMPLENHKVVYVKSDLNYNSLKRKNLFVKSPTTHASHVTCHCCGRVGHKSYVCNARKIYDKNVKMIWVPKGTMCSNPKGSKLAWIPRSHST